MHASVKADEPEPETAAAHILKGQKLFAAKKVEEAQAAFQKAAELEPNNPTAKIGQFAILLHLGHPMRDLPFWTSGSSRNRMIRSAGGLSFTLPPMQNVLR